MSYGAPTLEADAVMADGQDDWGSFFKRREQTHAERERMDVQVWLKQQMVSAAAYDAEVLLARFLAEMEHGLSGNVASLEMIPSYVTVAREIPHDVPVAVIDAGGTNLRVGMVRLEAAGRAAFSHFTRQAIPGRDTKVCAADFYDVLVDALAPFVSEVAAIGFCFSYPATITPDHDGVLLRWTKEIKIPELVGRRVGAGLLSALEARGMGGKRLIILNDTVAALLAGEMEGARFNASSYVGVILGTGTNTAYIERNRNIGQPAEQREECQVINVESGAFTGFERGPIDKELDAASREPGVGLLEKAVSGVYMGPLALRLLKALVPQGVFSDSGADKLAGMTALSTIAIDALAAGRRADSGILNDDSFTESDRKIMTLVFNGVVDRAALLTAVNIAAAVIKGGGGQDALRPVCVNIDGATYYKTFQLAAKVQTRLQPMMRARGLHVRCINVPDAPVIGAAIAAISSFRSPAA